MKDELQDVWRTVETLHEELASERARNAELRAELEAAIAGKPSPAAAGSSNLGQDDEHRRRAEEIGKAIQALAGEAKQIGERLVAWGTSHSISKIRSRAAAFASDRGVRSGSG